MIKRERRGKAKAKARQRTKIESGDSEFKAKLAGQQVEEGAGGISLGKRSIAVGRVVCTPHPERQLKFFRYCSVSGQSL
jgi:hypothetical protein